MGALLIVALLAAGFLANKPMACDVNLTAPNCIEIRFENPKREFMFNNFEITWADVRESQYDPDEVDPLALLIYESLQYEPIVSMGFVDDSVDFCFDFDNDLYLEMRENMSAEAWNGFVAEYLRIITVRVIECIQADQGVVYETRWHMGEADDDTDDQSQEPQDDSISSQPGSIENQEIPQSSPPSPILPPE